MAIGEENDTSYSYRNYLVTPNKSQTYCLLHIISMPCWTTRGLQVGQLGGSVLEEWKDDLGLKPVGTLPNSLSVDRYHDSYEWIWGLFCEFEASSKPLKHFVGNMGLVLPPGNYYTYLVTEIICGDSFISHKQHGILFQLININWHSWQWIAEETLF